MFFGIKTIVGAFIGWIILAFSIWASQKFVLEKGKERSLISCFGLALVGTVAGTLLGLSPFIGWLLSVLAWVFIIKSWFDIGWGRAIIIAILAWIILSIINFLTGLLRLTL